MHQPIFINNLSLSFTEKCCFKDFSAQIPPNSRIAVIGRNGSGKSSLLKILRGALQPSEGNVFIPESLDMGYVEQAIAPHEKLSGGEWFNKELTKALTGSPDMLILDEPTNHLDQHNHKALIRMLKNFYGTVIVASHDVALLSSCINTLWHIDNGKIHLFTGAYDDYIQAQKQLKKNLEKALVSLKRERSTAHTKLMKEQKRAAVSRAKGQKSIGNRKWPTIVSNAKARRSERTSGRKKSAIEKRKKNVVQQLSALRLPEIILPRFSLNYENKSSRVVLTINSANVGYGKEKIVLKNISLSIVSKERIAITGKNASGKSTLLKAILGAKGIYKTGKWYTPQIESIGYLDQHYDNLIDGISVFDHLKQIRPLWNEAEIRQHLSDFLFRKNEEVDCLVNT